jgi:hypothetical protein
MLQKNSRSWTTSKISDIHCNTPLTGTRYDLPPVFLPILANIRGVMSLTNRLQGFRQMSYYSSKIKLKHV